jgi:excisionase family DNA binding protein
MSNLRDSVAASFTTRAKDETRAIGGRVRPANENELAVEDVDAVLDVEEVARLLRVGRNTIYELVGRNEIPHRRLRKQIRFSRAVILRWLGGNDVPR